MGIVVEMQELISGSLLYKPNHLIANGVNRLQARCGIIEQTPEVRNVDDGVIAADIAAVYLSELQRAVTDEPQRVRPGQTQFRKRCHLDFYTAIGALCNAPGVLGHVIERRNGAGDVGTLDNDDVFGRDAGSRAFNLGFGGWVGRFCCLA